MNENELIELARSVEIGGHTVTHPDLPTLSRADAEAEMRGGKEALESILGRPVDVFAYPWGTATDETAAACRAAGFVAACARPASAPGTIPFACRARPSATATPRSASGSSGTAATSS